MTPSECIDHHFRAFIKTLEDFPNTSEFSEFARQVIEQCINDFARGTADQRLMGLIEVEYRLFRMVERQLCQKQIQRMFRDLDEFLSIAQSITNRRKTRAGRSLENHVAYLLRSAGIHFDARAKIDGKAEPDILIPGKRAYEDPSFPVEKLRLVGLKTTCKDRWRQVLNEGQRVRHKHILTLQRGISANQLAEMRSANLTLVVPSPIQREYPDGTGIPIITVEQFIQELRAVQSGFPPSLFP